MKTIACGARAHLGKGALFTLVLMGLSACGADDVASNATASSAGSASLVSPRVGFIDREPATPILTSPPATASENPPATGSGSGTGSSGSGTTTGTPGGNNSQKPGVPPVPVSSGSATVDWLPPTQNSDGSTLTNLAGYTVYYGTSPDQLTRSIKVTNPGLTAYTVSNLTPGKWYFAISSYSSSGAESALSGVIGTQI